MTTTTSRRAVLAGAPALAVALPSIGVAAAIEADPTYALIDAHRRAYNEWIAVIRREEEVISQVPQLKNCTNGS